MAEDQIIEVKPCGFFCQVWRNVSGKADVAYTRTDDGDGGPVPSVTDGAEKPKLGRIVAQRGVVSAPTVAEQGGAVDVTPPPH